MATVTDAEIGPPLVRRSIRSHSKYMPCRVSQSGAQPLDERSRFWVELRGTALVLSKGRGKGSPLHQPPLPPSYSRQSAPGSPRAALSPAKGWPPFRVFEFVRMLSVNHTIPSLLCLANKPPRNFQPHAGTRVRRD